ncbi:MAG: TlpA family protein disulfide reductase [Acidimicrobiia bacterium]|nr:TlpA family protein disulfide reductase [Acidimicrobiia bacterium]
MSQKSVIALVVGGLVAVVALITTIVVLAGGADNPPPSGISETAPVAVDGDALPARGQSQVDPAVGLPIPAVTGSTFDGSPVSIDPTDGRPKALLFLAHWCQHCQAEAPEVQAWVDAGGLPDAVDLIGIATSSSDIRPNYPPSEWLEGVAWSSPVMVDDEAYTTAKRFGLEAFPYWVFVAADGTVAGRVSGRIPMTTLQTVIADLAGG